MSSKKKSGADSAGCRGNCLSCGKCKEFTILDSFGNEAVDKVADKAQFTPRKGYGLAVDIGTTTVVLLLLDLATGAALKRHSFMNPQRAYGPDVISRIQAANTGALFELRRVITESIASGIDTLLTDGGTAPPEKITLKEIAVAGNTVMIHLLLGLSCESLGIAPFKPAQRLAESYSLFDAVVTPIPWLAGFVGGDILAGLLYIPKKERVLLIDLGTNGEMALYDGGSLTVTSTAAGLAFEGCANLLSASEVISELARLVRTGAVDKTGLLKTKEVFTQKEIRDLQLAKSAVRSGLEILLDAAGLKYGDLAAVYLAGGIGQAMNVRDAMTIGLLPAELTGKVSAVGNAALGGAACLLLRPEQSQKEIRTLLNAVREINLAAQQRFNELFMENMFFAAAPD